MKWLNLASNPTYLHDGIIIRDIASKKVLSSEAIKYVESGTYFRHDNELEWLDESEEEEVEVIGEYCMVEIDQPNIFASIVRQEKGIYNLEINTLDGSPLVLPIKIKVTSLDIKEPASPLKSDLITNPVEYEHMTAPGGPVDNLRKLENKLVYGQEEPFVNNYMSFRPLTLQEIEPNLIPGQKIPHRDEDYPKSDDDVEEGMMLIQVPIGSYIVTPDQIHEYACQQALQYEQEKHDELVATDIPKTYTEAEVLKLLAEQHRHTRHDAIEALQKEDLWKPTRAIDSIRSDVERIIMNLKQRKPNGTT